MLLQTNSEEVSKQNLFKTYLCRADALSNPHFNYCCSSLNAFGTTFMLVNERISNLTGNRSFAVKQHAETFHQTHEEGLGQG